MTARTVILPPPPDAAPASRQCMPPAPCGDEPADSTRVTVPGGYTPDLDIAARMADAGAWYESEEP